MFIFLCFIKEVFEKPKTDLRPRNLLRFLGKFYLRTTEILAFSWTDLIF